MKLPVAGKRVAIQEYGVRNEEFMAELRRREARIMPVPVYGWQLPEDIGPLRAAIDRIVAGEVEVALFTSSNQVDNLFRVAAEIRRAGAPGVGRPPETDDPPAAGHPPTTHHSDAHRT